MNSNRKIIQAPPWLVRFMTPMFSRLVAREMIKKYPDLGAAEIIAKMRTDVRSTDETAQQFLAAVERRLPKKPRNIANPDVVITWYSPSSLVLIIANLLPLYGVMVLDWQVFPVMLLFWLENVTIGVLNALRMLLADPADPALWAGKLFMIPFFCFHYGLFTMIHGVFVFALFGGNVLNSKNNDLPQLHSLIQILNEYDLTIPLIALGGSHLFSFFWNYLFRGQFRRTALSELMSRPYNRIIILHLTLLFGGMITLVLNSPLWALLMLICFKIGIDLSAHMKEHRKAGDIVVNEPTVIRRDTI